MRRFFTQDWIFHGRVGPDDAVGHPARPGIVGQASCLSNKSTSFLSPVAGCPEPAVRTENNS